MQGDSKRTRLVLVSEQYDIAQRWPGTNSEGAKEEEEEFIRNLSTRKAMPNQAGGGGRGGGQRRRRRSLFGIVREETEAL